MTQHSVLVLGGAHIDRRGRIVGDTAPGASNPGTWFEEAGGGGLNAARNLAQLGIKVRLISPRGGDAEGETVGRTALAAGIDDTPFTFLDRRTPSYTAILERDGNLVIALADMDLYRLFSPRRLHVRHVRDAIDAAGMIVTDANLPGETLTRLASMAKERGKPLAGIAISPAKVLRFRDALPQMTFLFMNEAEAFALTGETPGTAEGWPALLRAAGLRGGVVTRGGREAIAFDTNGQTALAPPPIDELGDVTGAGDAMAAGFLWAFQHGHDLPACLRHGTAAAGITVRSPFAVAETMGPETLAEALSLVPAAPLLR
ncbi:carbohydrate kinase family protein [Pararhizobium sp.]|uniref:carbohydrate kinase family protein n=1 Tax=Pararhizobium sp. TaxID=1977563 RepID=UPI0027189EE5|nr:carbohydrate kinase family protein [Pararhizobium sp.]MDO9418903.1 carbohydrate kinase family protein [Pararhizobium sp.]